MEKIMKYLIIIFSFLIVSCGILLPHVSFQAINDNGKLKLQANSSKFTALNHIRLSKALRIKDKYFGSIAPVFRKNGKFLFLDVRQKKVEFDYSCLKYPIYTNSLYQFSIAIGDYDVEIYFILFDVSEPDMKKELNPSNLSENILVLDYSKEL